MLSFTRSTPAATRRSVVRFQGLDRSAGAGEGWFAQQEGLSTRRHPYLSPARSDKVEDLTDANGIFVWDGVRVTARAGQLWYGEEPVCNLTEGAKQFAVINSKLVVWPDGVAVDLTDHSVTSLAARAVNRGTASFTTKSLTLLPESVYANTGLRYKSYNEREPYLWTYDSVAWDETSGWTVEGGQWELVHNCKGRYYIPRVTYNEAADSYSAQYPTSTYTTGTPTGTGEPGNDLGFYVRITKVAEHEQTVSSYKCTLEAQIFWAQQAAQRVSGLFRVGDAVSVSGTVCGACDVEKRIIRDINDDTNTLTFDPGTFRPGEAVGQLSKDLAGTLCVRWTLDDTTYRYKITRSVTARAGWYVIADRSAGVVRMYDGDWVLQGEHAMQSITSTSGYTTLYMSPMAVTQQEVTVTRPVPALDYICQHDNRLWGVCSADNTIYASALGDPCTFYAFDGLSTDSYAVAVGSQGPFTGLCSYGGDVLCWKEECLHKVLGTLPENYQLTTYTLPGVARDSGASLVAVAQRLYYLGRDGVYAWSGGLPTLLSQGLGEEPLTCGVGGTDGKCYYLSVKRGQETELLVYDARLGLWTRRDGRRALAFARGPEGLLCLTEQGVYTLEAGDGVMDWQGELAPMYESLDRVQYTGLRLRVHLEPGSRVTVEACYDGGRWQRLGTVRAAGHRVAELRLPLRRCAVLQLRLSGQGDCTLLELEREYRKRGRG